MTWEVLEDGGGEGGEDVKVTGRMFGRKERGWRDNGETTRMIWKIRVGKKPAGKLVREKNIFREKL